MGSPFDDVDGELRLIQYRPHQNCHLVARFLGDPDIQCDGGTEGVAHLAVRSSDTGDDWKVATPGDWIATRDGMRFEIVDADQLIDYIKGTTHTHLIA